MTKKEKYMADAWRSSGHPTECLKPKLHQVKTMYHSEASSGNELRKIDSFLRSLERCVNILVENFLSNSRFQGVQQLLPSRRMVVNVLCKMHEKIIRRLRPTPRLADLWSGEFLLDLPMELFRIISKEIIEHNNHGHTMNKTAAMVTYTFTTFGKAKFVFYRMNLEGIMTGPEHLLKKQLSSGCDTENLK